MLSIKTWLLIKTTGSAIIHILATVQILTTDTSVSTPVLYQIVPAPVWAIVTSIAATLLLLGWRDVRLAYYGLAVAAFFWGAAAAATVGVGYITGNHTAWFTAIFLSYICFMHAWLCVSRLFIPRELKAI